MFVARFIGTVTKDFPQLLVFVRKGSRNSLMLPLFLHTCSSGAELLLAFILLSLGMTYTFKKKYYFIYVIEIMH